MPQESYSGKDGQKKYRNTFFVLTNSAKLALQESVLQVYQQQIDPNYTPKLKYIRKLYDLWYEQREDVLRTYTDTFPECAVASGM